MITFDRTSQISTGLGISGYPLTPAGYCIYNNYLMVTLHGTGIDKIMVFTIDNDGVLTLIKEDATIDGDGIYTDGTYIFTGSPINAYTFDGVNFNLVASTALISGRGPDQMAFGDNNIIFCSKRLFAYNFRAVKFDGSSFTFLHELSFSDLYPGNLAGIYYNSGRLFGVRVDGVMWNLRAFTYDETIGFTLVEELIDVGFMRGWRVQNLNKIIYNKNLYRYDIGTDSFSLIHTFDVPVYSLRNPRITEDNILVDGAAKGAFTMNGVNYLDATGQTYHGAYLPLTENYFYFKFGGYEILLNDERLGDNSRFIQAGNFEYAPELNADFSGNPRAGQRMLTVNFTNLST